MELLTINETAKILKVSPLTVRRYIARDILHAKRLGRTIRIPRSELERLGEPEEPEFETLGSSPLKGQPTTKDDPLWKLIGIGESSGPTDVSRRKHDYLAEAYEDLTNDLSRTPTTAGLRRYGRLRRAFRPARR